MLKELRGISFEQIELAIATGDLVDRLSNPNPWKISESENLSGKG